MTRTEALEIVGLTEGASEEEIESAYSSKKSSLEKGLQSAPSEALKAKFQDKLTQLETAKTSLKQARQTSSMSQTKMADLPQANASFTGHDGTSQAGAQLQLSIGQILAGRYEIKEQIGAGGMGAVFRAFDKNRNEDIAIKVLLPALTSNEKARERFLDEARLSSQLSHPNIVNVFDVQHDGDYYFLTMELLEGQDLRQVMENRSLARQNFPSEEVVEIIQAICEGLNYAHQQTVHRDIKPENIWITEEGEYKLMDFGIARLMSTSQRTQTGAAMGTAYYMSPEQLKGAKDIDGRADQYALAVLFYELMSGEVPAGAIEPLHKVNKSVGKKLSDVIAKALSPKPENRFEDIKAFSDALNAKGSSISAPSIDANIIKIAGGVLLTAGLIFGITQSGINLGGLLPESEEVIQQRYMQAVQLEGEVKDLASRLENTKRSLEESVRDAENNVRRLEGKKGHSSAKKELKDAEAIEQLVQRVIFESSSLTELKGKKTVGEAMVRDKKYKEAIKVLTTAKEHYQHFLDEANSAQPMYLAKANAQKKQQEWKNLKNKYSLKETDTKEKTILQEANTQKDQGKINAAKGIYQKAIAAYETLMQSQSVSEGIAATKARWQKDAKARAAAEKERKRKAAAAEKERKRLAAIWAKNAPVTINGLMWQDEVYTKKERSAYNGNYKHGKAQNWEGAKQYCRDLNYAGYTDWSLPSKSQLKSLYYNKSQLKNNMSDVFWSSTEKDSSRAWNVYFYDGSTYNYYRSGVRYVRCVR